MFRTLSLMVSLALCATVMATDEKPKFRPNGELVDPDMLKAEQGVINALAKGVAAQLKTPNRDAHAHSHGCIEGAEFTINQKLPKELEVGVFKDKALKFPAVLRTSNGSGDPKASDLKKGAHGLALKLLLPADLKAKLHAIPEEQRFVDSKYYDTQDFLHINDNAGISMKTGEIQSREFFSNVDTYGLFFAARGAQAKALAEGKSEEEANEAFAKMFLKNEKGEIIRPKEGRVLFMLGNVQMLNPLLERYHSQVPSHFGEHHDVKYMLAPCTPENPLAKEALRGVDGTKEGFLRKVLETELQDRGLCYKLYAQFRSEGMPSVEDAPGIWPLPKRTSLDPWHYGFVELGTVTAPKGTKTMDDKLCEAMSFTPWHSLPEHLPEGGIQRARRTIYFTIHNKRNELAGLKPIKN